ncbi:MAG TPA: hypothetical protein DEP53_02055 [Bacteroidetes bacterium]|nr:hypothetical protein [Bacteroidota bacterium]
MGIILSETLFGFENPIFRVEFSYFDFWNHRSGDRIQTLDDPKMCWMNILRTRIAVQGKGLNGTRRCHVAGPGEEVISRDNTEISPLDKMSAGLMVGRIENEEVSLV